MLKFYVICYIFSMLIFFIFNMFFGMKSFVPLEQLTLGECLTFGASIFEGLSTIILGIVAIVQTQKANDISDRLLKKEIAESDSFIQLLPKIKIDKKKNMNITMSAPHKTDSGALVVLEKGSKDVKEFNEYYIRLFFKDSSKTAIKKIKVDNILSVQDPNEKDGIFWGDKSNNPIPCGLEFPFDEELQLNWIEKDEFYIHLKVYSKENGLFSSMMENNSQTCLILSVTIINVLNKKSKFSFKIWLRKDNNQFKVIHSNTNVND